MKIIPVSKPSKDAFIIRGETYAIYLIFYPLKGWNRVGAWRQIVGKNWLLLSTPWMVIDIIPNEGD
jgi:hypothetical protein